MQIQLSNGIQLEANKLQDLLEQEREKRLQMEKTLAFLKETLKLEVCGLLGVNKCKVDEHNKTKGKITELETKLREENSKRVKVKR